jgi:hypothetical protein
LEAFLAALVAASASGALTGGGLYTDEERTGRQNKARQDYEHAHGLISSLSAQARQAGGKPEHALGELHCIDRSAKASTAIKPAINSDETVAAIVFALGFSFHDRRP